MFQILKLLLIASEDNLSNKKSAFSRMMSFVNPLNAISISLLNHEHKPYMRQVKPWNLRMLFFFPFVTFWMSSASNLGLVLAQPHHKEFTIVPYFVFLYMHIFFCIKSLLWFTAVSKPQKCFITISRLTNVFPRHWFSNLFRSGMMCWILRYFSLLHGVTWFLLIEFLDFRSDSNQSLLWLVILNSKQWLMSVN